MKPHKKTGNFYFEQFSEYRCDARSHCISGAFLSFFRSAEGQSSTDTSIHESMNNGVGFDSSWLTEENFNLPAIKKRAGELGKRRSVKKSYQAAWLFRAVTCIDLTTLSGDDTRSNVERLCHKAVRPIRDDIVRCFGMQNKNIKVGAVCVYPNRVAECKEILKTLK